MPGGRVQSSLARGGATGVRSALTPSIRRDLNTCRMKSPSTFHLPTARTSLAGIGLMLAGIGLFSINDALGKWLLTTYSVGELLLIRSAAALVLLVPFVRQAGLAAFRTAPRPGLQIAAGRPLHARSGDVLLGGIVSAARRYRDLLSRRPDLRDRAFGRSCSGARRLAALDRRAGRLCRRDDGDAPDRGEPHPAGADRAHRQRVLFAADDHHAPAARDIEYAC